MKKLTLILLILLTSLSVRAGAQEISLATLLDEATDRAAITRTPNYRCYQASSYDRGAKSPNENWFANNDASNFIRSERNGDREEWVLMEAEGPGAIVRWWITAPHYKNNIYAYIDGELAFSGPIADYIGGSALADAPLSEESSRGRNLYLPIPYAKSVKITCDQMPEQGNLYYQINYRQYPEGVSVRSFSTTELSALKDKVARTNQLLLLQGSEEAEPEARAARQGFRRYVSGDLINGLYGVPRILGPGAITEISVKLKADDVALATRQVAIMISFDGEETVWAPIGDFFGSGVGVNPTRTRYTEVCEDGTFKCFWRMPFSEEARLSFQNFGDQDVSIHYEGRFEKCPVGPETMRFHANWRQERGIQTEGGKGVRDWNYTTIEGAGVYVGDVLSLFNPVTDWWGEGDEKIYVDGEEFPSHFGTGTEDYYGYAWGSSQPFKSPFHAQPRVEGHPNRGVFGRTTVERFRVLDGVPFTKSLKFDMEIWHWKTCEADYAVTTFWYGVPGAKIAEGGPDREEFEDEAAVPVAYNNPFRTAVRDFELGSLSEGASGVVEIQGMGGFRDDANRWVDDRQIFWREGKVGDSATLVLERVPAGKKALLLGATLARDYGIAQFYWNGEKIGEPVDFYNADKVIRKTIRLEIPETTEGKAELKVEIVGKNDASIGCFLGFDSATFED